MFWAIMVFPRPWAATSTTLGASARKSSRKAASTAGRSMRLGQTQSNSLMRVKRQAAAGEAALEAAAGALVLFALDEMLQELGDAPPPFGGEADEVVQVRGGVA